MENFDSITHFLQLGGFEYRVFDMGRKISAIANDDFECYEKQQEAYPYPFQQMAWLALLLWSKNSEKEPVIWFLQFPIDEMGFLKQEARDSFLISLLEQAGKNIQANLKGDGIEDGLKESPYAFKPQEDRLAVFHAFANKVLAKDPSSYYQATREYLLGNLGFDQWYFLGLQGIADVVVNLDRDGNEQLLAKALGLLPEAPLSGFCRALENVSCHEVLGQALVARLNQELDRGEDKSTLLLSLLLRAISGIQSIKKRQSVYLEVLNLQVGQDIEVLVAISTRSWSDLLELKILGIFLANLVKCGQVAFNTVLTDLLMIPGMKDNLWREVKAVNKTEAVNLYLRNFLKDVRNS